MPEYTVEWQIELSAATPLEAAREARRIQLDRNALVGAFNVYAGDTGETTHIDLDEEN